MLPRTRASWKAPLRIAFASRRLGMGLSRGRPDEMVSWQEAGEEETSGNGRKPHARFSPHAGSQLPQQTALRANQLSNQRWGCILTVLHLTGPKSHGQRGSMMAQLDPAAPALADGWGWLQSDSGWWLLNFPSRRLALPQESIVQGAFMQRAVRFVARQRPWIAQGRLTACV